MIRSPLRLLAAAVVLTAATAVPGRANPADQAPAIDVVLCLDVSGSMEGLVNSARIKMWDLVNGLAKVKPTPTLRVGLYSYGHTTYDPNAGWVRKESDLTTDLDEVYKKLNNLTINGGEEYVARVCRDALVQQKWAEGKNSLKLIFVCGNEPVDQDKQVHLKDVARLAKEKGVIINTIYCNWGHPDEEAGWKTFAADAAGQYALIEHNQKVVQIVTPQDKELVRLNEKLNGTFIAFAGHANMEKKANQLAQDANAGAAGAPALASRVATKGGALYRNEAWCIVSKAMVDKDFDISKVPEDQLPDELKKMKPEERVAYVKKKIAEREQIQKEIAEVNAQRAKYIAEESKKSASASDKALDTALRGMIREEAASRGIKVPE
ncbi:MAG: vWA domain-containing protein [Gemmataceae bacterium]